MRVVLGSVLVAAGVDRERVGSAFLSGKEWARRFYLWVTPLVLVVEIVVGDNGVIQSGFSWWRSAIGLGAYCAFAFALTRPKASAFFKRATRASVAAAYQVLHPTPGVARASPGALPRYARSARVSTSPLGSLQLNFDERSSEGRETSRSRMGGHRSRSRARPCPP